MRKEKKLSRKKVWAFKMKRRKSYRRTIGHRQNLTKVKVTAIVEK